MEGWKGVETPGMGRGFRAKPERRERSQDESTRGVSVQRVTPGGVLGTDGEGHPDDGVDRAEA